MNQEQIKMGMKISKKISKKNANNKHGTFDESQKILEKMGIPKDYKFHNDMVKILCANSDNMFIKKFNKWYSSLPEIYNALGGYINKFFNYCFERFRSINPNYSYDSKTHKIILDKPSDDLKRKLDVVPINPTSLRLLTL